MTISEAKEKTGLSLDTLRYYEKVGLIPPVRRDASGKRDYGESDIYWIEFAKCMRAAGLSIEVLAEYLRLYMLGDETFEERLQLLNEQRENLTARLNDVQRSIDRLDLKIARYRSGVNFSPADFEGKGKG